MNPRAAALAAFALALAAGWLLLLAWAAGATWSAPIAPAQERSFPGSRFRAVFGSARVEAQRLQVEAPGEEFSALQTTVLPELPAADFPLLRYRFEDFPRTLELSLVFRTAEEPDDVQTLSLPWAGSGTASVDLSAVPAWQGTIIELGFAQFATAQLVPPERGFAPFALVGADLWSVSWRGDLAALATDWFGAWPWSQRSVHALGRDGGGPRERPVLLFVALAIALAIALAALLLGLRGRRLAVLAAMAVALGWFALDLRWQAGLVQRLLATRTLYAGVDWPARERLVGDSDLLDDAARLRSLVADQPARTRILVQSGSPYTLLRLIWHLLPLNVAALVHAQPFLAALPDGCLLVFHATDTWRTQPAMRRLLAHSERITGPDRVLADGFEAERVVVFRYHHAH
jgi:hypothetical protein